MDMIHPGKKQLALESQLDSTELRCSQLSFRGILQGHADSSEECREMQGMNFTAVTWGWQALRLFRLLFYHKMLLGILETSDVDIKDLSSFS